MATKSEVNLIFGCLEFGRKMTVEQTSNTIDYLLSKGIKSLDTAFYYSGGKSEIFMGQHSACNSTEKTIIATKGNIYAHFLLFLVCLNAEYTQNTLLIHIYTCDLSIHILIQH